MLRFSQGQLDRMAEDSSCLIQECRIGNWIEIRLVSEAGHPCAYLKYRLVDDSGQIERVGDLDENGFAREEDLKKNDYKVLFGSTTVAEDDTVVE